MSIATELTALQTDITNARTAITTKGGTVTTDGGSSQLATDIATIPSGMLPNAKFYGDNLTSSGSVAMTGQGKTYNGVWTSEARLPAEYQEVEWIGSSGTQYINTGHKFTSNYGKVDITFSITSMTSGTQQPFGSYLGDGNGTRSLCMFYSSSTSTTGSYTLVQAGDNNFTLGQLQVGTEYNLSFEANNGTATYSLNGDTSTGSYSGTIVNNLDWWMFAMNYNGLFGASNVNIKSCKLYATNNMTLVRDFVPCYRVSDDVIGLYDLVNDVFYDNDGTGTFTKGNDVAESGYFLVSDITDLGEYTYTATQGSATETGTVDISITTNVSGLFDVEIVSWSSGTPEELKAMIDAHYAGVINIHDYWALGDTRTITLPATSPIISTQSVDLVLMDSTCNGFKITADNSTPIFIVGFKNCLGETGYMNTSNTNYNGWSGCGRRNILNTTIKSSMDLVMPNIFKQFTWKTGQGIGSTSGLITTNDYFALPPEKAIFGSTSYSFSDEAALYSQWDWYKISSNKIKKVGSSNYFWWESSPASASYTAFCNVGTSENARAYEASNTGGISPFGCI